MNIEWYKSIWDKWHLQVQVIIFIHSFLLKDFYFTSHTVEILYAFSDY